MSFKANVVEVLEYAVEHKALNHFLHGVLVFAAAALIVYLSMPH